MKRRLLWVSRVAGGMGITKGVLPRVKSEQSVET